jgi:hypothetical protein
MSTHLFDTLKQAMAKRGHDTRYPGAATVMGRAALDYADIRAMRDAVRSDKNLSPTGQRTKIVENLGKLAAGLQKHRRMIDQARATIDAKRAAMKPKFDKVEPVVLVAVAARLAAMKPGEHAALVLPAGGAFDQIAAQAVLTLPPILTGITPQIREMCEGAIMEKNHGPALAAIEDEKEAWNTADAALNTATNALSEAGEFPSPHAFNLWLEKVAPPSPQALAAEAREIESFAAQSILIAAEPLSYDTRKKLFDDLLNQQTYHVNADRP